VEEPVWYNSTHKTNRTMLLDLENIKKVFINKYNENAKANKTRPRMQQPPRLVKHACPGSAEMEACLIKFLIIAILLSIAAGARLMEGLI
jgi:hypothetical protein